MTTSKLTNFANLQGMVSPLSNSYTKLHNPLNGIFQSLPVVDGLDANKLLEFLEILLKAKEFPGISDEILLMYIFPQCRSPLSTGSHWG